MKRPHKVTEKSKQNLTGAGRFANNTELAKECQKLSVAKRLENREKEKQIEKTIDIINRILAKKVKSNISGEEITQKEVLCLSLLNKAIVEKDLRAIEIILKLLGDFNENTVVNFNQAVQVNQQDLNEAVKIIHDLK